MPSSDRLDDQMHQGGTACAVGKLGGDDARRHHPGRMNLLMDVGNRSFSRLEFPLPGGGHDVQVGFHRRWPSTGRTRWRASSRAAANRSWRSSAADAGKEGGFLGFGAEQVSAGERRML